MLINLEPSQVRAITTRCLISSLEEYKDYLTKEQIESYLFVIREVATPTQYQQFSKGWKRAQAATG